MAFEAHFSPEFDAQLDAALLFRKENYGARSMRKLVDDTEHIVNLLSLQPFMESLVDAGSDDVERDSLRWVRMQSYLAICRPHPDDSMLIMGKLFAAGTNWHGKVLS